MCPELCHHGLDRTPGPRRARASAGPHRAVIRRTSDCLKMRRLSRAQASAEFSRRDGTKQDYTALGEIP